MCLDQPPASGQSASGVLAPRGKGKNFNVWGKHSTPGSRQPPKSPAPTLSTASRTAGPLFAAGVDRASAGRRLGAGSGHYAGSSVVSAAQTPELRDRAASGSAAPNPGCSPHSARSTEERVRPRRKHEPRRSQRLSRKPGGWPVSMVPPSQTPSHS